MRKRHRKNPAYFLVSPTGRRGQLEVGATPIKFYSVIVFVLLIIIFFALFAVKKGNVSGTLSGENLVEVEANTALLNYLRTPINFEGKEMTVADLIVLTKDNINGQCRYGSSGNKYCDKLREAAEILDKEIPYRTERGRTWKMLIIYSELSGQKEVEIRTDVPVYNKKVRITLPVPGLKKGAEIILVV